MAWGRRIESELAALTAELEELDREIVEVAEEISACARSKSLPEAWQDTSGEGAFSNISVTWAKARRSLADLVGAMGRRVDTAMAPLEDKPQPTRKERLKLAWQHLLSMDWTPRRAPQVTSLDQALVLSDRLHGLLAPRRERIIALRHAVESDLVELTGHRQALADAIVTAAEQEEREVSAVWRMVEHALQAVQDLTMHLNHQIRDMNAALHKLTIDSERAIVLSTVLAEERAERPLRHALDEAKLPNLAPLIDLNDAGMLSNQELERRRGRVDQRFVETFHETPAQGQTSADEGDEVQDTREVSRA
ncbi:septal ring factor EnvC (AmiA/AmiB activator) [Pseudorhizobium tarimense]|uniref:Septal ring factor EnvC (AmiA/AmiB activator) n=1 Tax=Pseudorhizobium tarimense TaxID=1079109 RepID=A0ABV2H745_9HYPH|nr:hypothetical protein [Pseudorhizobium tarimense]MCJ8519409.1 hypothetical protein [Pseudorhizobium tarimense]